MLNIAICDDEKLFLQFLQKSLTEIFNELSIVASLHCFSNSSDMLTHHNKFDIVFLDIDMPQLSGFDAAEKLRAKPLDTYIIFVSSKHELVYKSFEYTPFYFICKTSPQNVYNEIKHAVTKLSSVFAQNKKISVSDAVLGEDTIYLKDIIYIQSDKHYLLYHTTKDSIPKRERNLLSNRKNELADCYFISPHKRFLINMRHIKRFDTLLNTIIMSNGAKIPISRSAKETVLEKYRLFKRK